MLLDVWQLCLALTSSEWGWAKPLLSEQAHAYYKIEETGIADGNDGF